MKFQILLSKILSVAEIFFQILWKIVKRKIQPRNLNSKSKYGY